MNTENNASINQKQGVINKCPSCGGALKAFASSCDLCGHELAGVGPNRTIAALAEKKLTERKEKFILERMQECNRRTMSRAQAIADSILRIESKIQKFKTFQDARGKKYLNV